MKNDNTTCYKDDSSRVGDFKRQCKEKICAVGVLLFLFSAPVFANPEGGQVTAGDATISAPDANTVQVNQSSNKAIVDWQSFNVKSNEQTKFQQPSSSAILLNRVNPANGVSSILGRITANGQIWIVNPAGILFGSSARVDVGGLLATTANISNEDFMSGNYRFVQSPDWHGAVINMGNIVVGDKGLVALMAPGVENHGFIQANLGTVILASGSEYTVDFYGDHLVNFDLNAHVSEAGVDKDGNKLKSAVSNTGTVVANDGTVLMSGDTVGRVLDNAVNMSGYVEVKAASVNKSGQIVLMGGEGAVVMAGNIDASGKQVAQKGGKVKILAKKITVAKGASIDASGSAGGGEILIGGNAHGAGPEVNAQYTFIANQANINADALLNGDGGKVIVWSDQATGFYGNIYSRGGIEGGNGGFVEVSGKENLGFAGYVNTLAPMGSAGTLLLDPRTLTVATGGTALLTDVDQFSDTPGTDLTIAPATINAASSNVVLQANRDILFNNNVAMTGAGLSLTAQAARSITLATGVSVSTNNGDILFVANDSTSGASSTNRTTTAGSITMNSTSSLNAGTGNITLTVDPSAVSPFNPGNITTNDLTGKNITVNSPNVLTMNGVVTSSGTVALNANTDGAGANNFSMAAGSSITTTNASSSAVAITANAGGAGTGTIALRDITTGAGGTITVTQNGANVGNAITQTAATALNVGAGGTINLSVLTAGTNAIGSTGANILTTSAGGTLNLTLGSGGAFITNTGSLTLSAPAVTSANYPLSVISSGTLTLPSASISTGTGALTFRSNGGSLATAGDLSTTTGAMTLVGSTGLTIGNALTGTSGTMSLSTTTSGDIIINSSGSISSTSNTLTMAALDAISISGSVNRGSGTIAISANTDGSGSQGFLLGSGGSITTTSTSTSAIVINVNAAGGGTGGASLDGGNITAGTTGRITIATNTGANTTGGSITQSTGSLSVAGAGSFILSTPTASASSIGSSSTPIATTSAGGTLTLTTGSGGAFVTNAGNLTLAAPTLATNSPLSIISSATLTLPAASISTGTGGLTLKSLAGALTIAGNLTTTSGNILLSSNTTLTIGTGFSVSADTGTISILANQGGAGANAFTMNASSSITTNNTGSSAVAINVNAAGGGTGGAALRNITTGSGGAISVATNTGGNTTGGSITQTAATALNVGTLGIINLSVPTASASAIGAVATNILTTSAGGTLNLTMGSGGAFVNNTGNLTLSTPTVTSANYPLSIISSGILTLPASSFSTGTGALTFRSNGGTLSTNANLTTGTGILTLVGSTGLTVGHTLTSGGGAINLSTTSSGDVTVNSSGAIDSTSGALTITALDNVSLSGAINEGSGLVTVNANSDASGSQGLVMNSGSSITTTNTTASAVIVNVNAAGGGTGGAQLNNIKTGNGGTITVNTAVGGNTSGGSIAQLSGGLLDANATGATAVGSIVLTTPTGGSSGIGTLIDAIQTRAGALLTLNAGSGGAFVTNIANGSGYTGSTTLGASTINGSFGLTSAGNVAQSGATVLTVTGTPTFTMSTATKNIVLGNANVFSAAPVFTSNGNIQDLTFRNTSASASLGSLPTGLRNVTLTFNSAGMVLPTLTATGTLLVTTGGAITQSGILDITGTTTLVAGAGNNITLGDTSNNFSTVAVTSGNNVTLTDVNALNLGTTTVSNLNVTGGGALSDTGNITVSGTLTAVGVGGVVFNSASNAFANLDVTNSTSGNITIVNIVPLTIVGFSQGGPGTISLTNTGIINVANGVTVGSNNATIGITATDLNLNSTGAIHSGTATTTITQNTASGSLGLGDTVGTMTISGAELQNITAGALTLVAPTNGQILVDNIALANSANIAGTITLTATAGTLGTITFENNGSSFKTLSTTSDNGTNINANVATTVGALGLTVNTGTLSVANGATASTNDLAINITATDLNLNASGSLNSGTAAVNITQNTASGSIGLGNTAGTMTISGAELQNIIAGSLALNAPSNGQIIVDGITAANSANIAGITTLTATAGTLGSITAQGGSSTFTNGVTVSTDNFFTVDNGATFGTANSALSITALDLDLSASGALNSGSGALTIAQNTATGSIGLGNAAGTMTISGAELQRITAGALSLNAPNNGQIIVDGITAANSANVSGLTTLTATVGTLGSIVFQNNASTFNELTANADNGVTVGVGLTTLTSNMILNGDVAGNGSLFLNADLTSAGSMTLSAASGGIILGNSINLVGNGVTLNNTVNGAYDLAINSGSGSATFSAIVGGNTALNSLSVTGDAAINTAGITTTGAQSYNEITLGANTTLVSTASGNIDLAGAINGAFGLTVNTGGTTTLAGVIGGVTPIASLTTDAPGNTIVQTNAITTSGTQTYSDPLTLQYAMTLRSSGANLIFNNTVNASSTLTMSAGNNVTLNDVGLVVGGNITINSGNLVSLGTTGLSTSGDARIVANNAAGRIVIGSLTLGTSAANFVGTINGYANTLAFNSLTLLNTITPGTHFFNGIDMATGTTLLSSVSANIIFPYYPTWYTPGDNNFNNVSWLDAQSIAMGLEPVPADEQDCIDVGEDIKICY